MRLLHVINSADPKSGGPSDSGRMFVAAHRHAGDEVELATLDDPKAHFLNISECEVHAFGPSRDRTNYHYSAELQKWLTANVQRFDGIVNGIWQFHAVVARRAYAGRRPYVVFAHGMLDPYFMRCFPLNHLKKLSYWVLLERKNLDLAEAVCFTSEEEMRIAAEGIPFHRRFKRVVVPLRNHRAKR